MTTAFYIDKALKRRHDVVTHGPAINEEIMRKWDLMELASRVTDHDLAVDATDLMGYLQSVKPGWTPDLFLFIETALWYPLNMDDIRRFPCPTACYLIDTYARFEKHLRFAENFDFVFLVERSYVEKFRERGIQNVFWLPVACDPEIHGGRPAEKVHDISFIGSLEGTTPRAQRRVELVEGLRRRFSLHYERCFLEKMAAVFSQSRLIFNYCYEEIADKLNMRVFEALASGSMLITNDGEDSAVRLLFEDGKHLAFYRTEEDLFAKVEYYLQHDEERERIAAEGKAEALRAHTYNHRAAALLEAVFKGQTHGS
jgi:hypothetical protein